MAKKMTVLEFLQETGMSEPMAPGQVKMKTHVGEKEGGSYCVVYDWSDPNKVRVELRPGLTGKAPTAEMLKNAPIWLQTQNFIEFTLNDKA